MPLHMVIPKPAKVQPRLAIGQPFQPATMPNIPESVTAVGDQTGKAYFRMGDNPAGPETVQVTPPRAPVSMATGGVVTIGNSILRTPPPGEDPLVGQANFLQSQDASKYSQLEVPQPVAVSAGNGPLFAGQTPALQSTADETLNNFKAAAASQELQDRIVSERRTNERQARIDQAQSAEDAGLVKVNGRYMSPFDAAVARARLSKAVSDTVNPNSALENQLEARKIEEETQRLRGNVPYQDPETGAISYMTPAQAAIRKYKDNKKLEQQMTGVGPGQELYTDPWTGAQKVLSKAESNIQQAKDAARISSAASGQYIDPETGEVTQLTPAQAAIARAQEAKRISQAVSGVPDGMEKYTDPFTGAQKVLTPAQAKLQQMKDAAAIKKEYEATLGPLNALSEEQLITEIAKAEKKGEGPNAQSQVFRDALVQKGFSPQAIEYVLGQYRDRKTGFTLPPTAIPSEGQ